MPQAGRIMLSVVAGSALALVPVLPAAASASAATVPVVHGVVPGGAAIYNAATRGTAHRVAGPSATAESTNWSGYALGESGATSAGGSWTVPSVVPSIDPEYSASWLGIDGVDNSQLIQTGTAQDTEGGRTYYYAWWEVLPAAEVQITTMTVSPGDRITAAIDKVATGEWRLTLDDVTAGESWSTTTAYSGPGDSAEWIEEAPTIDDTQASLADFGTVDFTGATVDGSSAELAADRSIDMVDADTGQVIATPSAPDSTDNGFTVTAGQIATPTPSPTVAAPSDELASGRTLPDGKRIVSPDGAFEVIMQSDGNLVEYTRSGRALWSSGTSGHPGARAVMQSDGNLVVYSGSRALWSSGTGGRGVAHAVVQDDANFVVYDNATGRATWDSGTNGKG